jgi:predicted nucleic acid-binding Zn ribbon protein
MELRMSQSEENDLQRIVANARPSGTPRGPQPISEILSRLMARRGYANQQVNYEWGAIWSAIAGSQAAQTRPGKFNRGVLEVIVSNSTLLQELTFRKKQLLKAIQQRASHFQVKDLRFRVGEID